MVEKILLNGIQKNIGIRKNENILSQLSNQKRKKTKKESQNLHQKTVKKLDI